MKLLRHPGIFFLPWVALALAGCQTHKETRAMRNGYEEVWHPQHTLIDDPLPPRISFQHRDSAGKITQIWPSLYGTGEVFHGDMALFVGERGDVAEHVTRPRLLAVTPDNLPLDLTDEILWRWTKANRKDFGLAMSRFTAITPVEKNGGLTVAFDFISEVQLLRPEKDWPDRGELWLSWNQIDEIVHTVKTKGVPAKDPRWHSAYIGERF